MVNSHELHYFSQLDERQRRLYAGLKATELGWRGVSQVCEMFGLNRKTVYKGKQELSLEVSLEKGLRSSFGKKKKKVNLSVGII